MAEVLELGFGNIASRAPTLRDLATIFFRHRRLLAISFILIALGGVAYAIFAPSYKAEMKILVRRGRVDPVVTPAQTPSPAFERDEVSEEEMNSEADLLRDDDILRKVVVETGLADRVTWFTRLRQENEEVRIERAVERLATQIEIQPVRKSRLISVSYSASTPQMSAGVLRSLAGAYLARHAEIHRPSGQQVFFESQIDEAARSLDQTQRRLVEFTRKKGVVSAELQRDLTLQKLSEAESADLGLRASIAESAERTRALEAKLQTLPERRVVQIKSSDNEQLQEKLKSKLLELELHRTELLTKFQPSYRLVQEVEHEISQTKAAIQAEDLKPLRDETTEQNPEYDWAESEQLKNQVELQALRQRQAVLQSEIAGYRAAAQKLGENTIFQRDLEQKLKATEEKYLLYLGKREEARISDSLDEKGILNVTVAEPPHVPALPTWPLWAATCLSFFGASVFSTGLAVVVDRLDPSFRTPEEIEQVLETPVLAALPKSGILRPRKLRGI